jgi:hypothetical protein
MGMVNDMQRNDKLASAVIQLHEIARILETEIGQGQLSEDIRKCADRLHIVTQPFKPQET